MVNMKNRDIEGVKKNKRRRFSMRSKGSQEISTVETRHGRVSFVDRRHTFYGLGRSCRKQ